MPYIHQFGSYVPERVVGNAEIAARIGKDPEWITSVSGIEERHFARDEETVADMAVRAAEDCLTRAGIEAKQVQSLILASSSSERRFPGPAAEVAHRLGLDGAPAFDVVVASAGSLFGLAMAANMTNSFSNVLVVASEKLSPVVMREPLDANTSILFGDGAGACLVTSSHGRASMADWVLGSDGTYTNDLRLEFQSSIHMNGRSVILQASRKIPRAIETVLARNDVPAESVGAFLMHQANQNLIDRVARAVGVSSERFYSNIRRFGNTSSASMLIAAAEWDAANGFRAGVPVVFAAFGAGFHWGALLAVGE